MVDLVKIRKKSKKGSGNAASAPDPEPHAEPQGTAPVTVTPPAPITSEAKVTAGSELSKLDRFKEAAGKRRDVAAAQVEVAVVERLELLTFVVAGEQYAVDIDTIVEIVRPKAVTKIPNADQSIVGIVSLRGTIVTLLDVRQKLRHSARTDSGADPRIIVVDRGGEIVGFEVDRVLRVVKIGFEAIEPHPVVHASEQDEAVRGVFRQGAALTILLDLDKLLEVA